MSSKDRRRSEKLEKVPGLITVTVSPDKLRAIFQSNKNASANDDTLTRAPSTPLPGAKHDDNSTSLSPNNATESTPNTPSGNHTATGNGAVNEGTPGPSQASMAPPNGPAADGTALAKKKGVKRSAAAAGVDGTGSVEPGSVNGDTPAPAPRVRSKPGPKKKAKLDDSGMVEISRGGAGGAHKLGPKASMGAINAGLRALDRSGKPCRKWAKRGFQVKSFTGVQWQIPRWKAPTKLSTENTPSGEESLSTTASADGSNKENGSKNTKDAKDAKDIKRSTDNKDSKDGALAKDTIGTAGNGASDKKSVNGGKANGVIAANGDTLATANSSGSDVEMTNAPSPSAEPATEMDTPVAAAA